ncbi:MAG: pyridoxal phosphate-dependent aminotransferase [candidate division KSB1 bacterium]|nr:pyridoxal phosphate-dependent aminotransferase [candidate division KSB1 bacterium]MDZ7304100.1 pyridoxal phosphate-dependent aminotransferase [candidate division KSB1 bacterium]MDZ7312080.1 pyridoxal phosphate-dependent aminotransferase [candidate division KSB1 bacterium]
MHFQESLLASRIQPSQTLAITNLVAELRRKGKEVIDLGAGEPDFDTPVPIKNAAVDAILQGKTKYTPNAGTLALREAIAAALKKDYGAVYLPNEIVVSNGAKQSLYNALLATCNPGEEVILPAPYWVSYPEQIRMVGAAPVFVQTTDADDFKMTPAALRAAITPRTRVLILNSPSNPTGTVYTTAELKALVEVIRAHEFIVLADEIYLKLIYEGVETTSLCSFPEIRDRLILVNGFSKAYAMTGWRLGYAAAPVAMAKAMDKIQSHTTSNACSISQEAGRAALRVNPDRLERMRQQFDERRRFVYNALSKMPGISVRLPKGAFYMFINVSQLLGHQVEDKILRTPDDLCQYLVQKAGVALVAGEAFGSNQHVRLSYATDIKTLQEAMKKLEKVFGEIMKSH